MMLLWKHLGFADSVPFRYDNGIANQSLPHPFAFFLKYAKGMRVLPRVLKFLTPEMVYTLFNTLLIRLECVEMANVSVNTEKENVYFYLSFLGGPVHGPYCPSSC